MLLTSSDAAFHIAAPKTAPAPRAGRAAATKKAAYVDLSDDDDE
jgi:hypothetical protein